RNHRDYVRRRSRPAGAPARHSPHLHSRRGVARSASLGSGLTRELIKCWLFLHVTPSIKRTLHDLEELLPTGRGFTSAEIGMVYTVIHENIREELHRGPLFGRAEKPIRRIAVPQSGIEQPYRFKQGT